MSSSSCRREISATCSPVGCCRKWACRSAAFRVATNQNDILYRLFTTGEYRVGEVHAEPGAVDGHPGGVELRALHLLRVGRDPARVREVMHTFKATGGYRFENFDRDTFSASRMLGRGDPRNHQACASRLRLHRGSAHGVRVQGAQSGSREHRALDRESGEVPGHDPRGHRGRTDASESGSVENSRRS